MVIQLLAGMFIGSVIVCLVGGFILKSFKNKADTSRRERDEIMRSLGELWVQIDKLISTNRGTDVESKSFKDSFKSKIDEINRLFKPNVHRFDVYYVKYIENLIAQYNHAVLNGETPIDAIAMSSDVELETNYSVVEQVVVGLKSVAATAESAPEKTSGTGFVQKTSGAEPKATQVAGNETPESPVNAIAGQSTGKKEIIAEEKTAIAAAPDTDVFELSSTTGDAPAAVPATGKSSPLPAIDSSGSKQESDNAFDFEVIKLPEQDVPRDVATKKAPETVTASGKAPHSTDDEEMAAFEQAVALPPAPQASEKKHGSGPSGDEEFTMETLIDVDISTISPYLKKESTAKKASPVKTKERGRLDVSSAKDTPQEDAANLEIVIAANASHTESAATRIVAAPVGEQPKKDEPVVDEKTAETAPKADSRDTADNVVDFEAFFEKAPRQIDAAPKPAEKAASSGVSDADIALFDKEEESITGDDVANKIAALESAGASAAVKDPVSKESTAKKDKPVAAVKPPVQKPVVSTPDKKNPAAGLSAVTSKPKAQTDSITGDDVADKIDAFFGLFDEKK